MKVLSAGDLSWNASIGNPEKKIVVKRIRIHLWETKKVSKKVILTTTMPS